jgi:hypothetical protein
MSLQEEEALRVFVWSASLSSLCSDIVPEVDGCITPTTVRNTTGNEGKE